MKDLLTNVAIWITVLFYAACIWTLIIPL